MNPFDRASRDPLHELEMTRALLAQARLKNPLNLTLIHGLEQEVAWWKLRAERVMARERSPEAARFGSLQTPP